MEGGGVGVGGYIFGGRIFGGDLYTGGVLMRFYGMFMKSYANGF